MVTEYAKECINVEDGRLIADALKELIINQTKKGAYEGDIAGST